MTRELKYRPKSCKMCFKPLPIAATGRVRITCSDRCRQAMRRWYNYPGYIDPKNHQKRMNRAERVLRKIEKEVGSLAIPVRPGDESFTLRDRLRMRLMRVELGDVWSELKFCVECRKPYVRDTYRKHRVCSEECNQKFKQYSRSIRAALRRDTRPWHEQVVIGFIRYKRFRLCKHCKLVFRSKDKRRLYCSDKCKDAAYWKRRPLRKCKTCQTMYRGTRGACSAGCWSTLYYRTSQHCGRCNKVVRRGAEILPNADTRMPEGIKLRKRSKAVVFCSGRCRDALGWIPMRKLCEGCGEAFYAKTRSSYVNGRYCSETCRERTRSIARYQQYKATRAPRVCRYCGDALPNEWQHAHGRLYCSDGCRKEAGRLRKQAPIAVEIGWIGRREVEIERVATSKSLATSKSVVAGD